MDSISKLEVTIEGWMKSFPHLPENIRKWIAQYAWVINLIGLILSVVMMIVAIGGLVVLYSMTSSVTANPLYFGLGGYSQAMLIASIVAILSFAVTIILTAMAIKPLKSMDKKGWDLLFIVALIEVIFSVISAIASFDTFSIIPDLIFTAIGFMISMYILFEVRSYFTKSGKIVEAKKVSEPTISAK